jgi:SAM-dependent methyltransferase
MVGVNDRVVWHDVENGGYLADLPVWRSLAAAAGGPVLDLGAGTGRVALELAAAGHAVTALDADRLLLDALEQRAGERGLAVRCVRADARSLAPLGRFALIIAPMQFVQIMGGRAGRAELLSGLAPCLVPGGTFAAAISDLDDAVPAEDTEPPQPDVGERQGWLYSSRPVAVRREAGGVAVEWLRQKVSPAGELTEERHTLALDMLSADELEDEAAARGLRPERRLEVAETEAYVGSTVVVCRR